MARIKNGTGRMVAVYISVGLGFLIAFATTILYVATVKADSTVNTRDIKYIWQNNREMRENSQETRELLHRIDKRQVEFDVKQELIMAKLGVKTPD